MSGRRRKAKAPSAPSSRSPASALAGQMEGLGVHPSEPEPEGFASPPTTAPADPPRPCGVPSQPAVKQAVVRACAGRCGAVGGKRFRCSRCQLAVYCSVDCQASETRARRREASPGDREAAAEYSDIRAPRMCLLASGHLRDLCPFPHRRLASPTTRNSRPCPRPRPHSPAPRSALTGSRPQRRVPRPCPRPAAAAARAAPDRPRPPRVLGCRPSIRRGPQRRVPPLRGPVPDGAGGP